MVAIKLQYPAPAAVTYFPVGQCIYCGKGSEAGSLSREHIIPYGLTGTLILPKASCPRCRKITGGIEGFYLQKMIRDARIHLNLASRRHRRNRGSPPPLLVGRRGRNGEVVGWSSLPKEQHPYWLITCGFAPPGVLTGADRNHKPLVQVCMIPGQDWKARWRMQTSNVAMEYKIDTDIYARVLAKVAHSFAVAVHGINNFEPFLPNIILGDNEMAHYFVGGPESDQDDRSADPRTLHSIGLMLQDRHIELDGPNFVTYIRTRFVGGSNVSSVRTLPA